MMEVSLEPIDQDSPCGPNLEYDADFLLLQEYASGKSDQQYGDTLIAAEPPDWTRVEQCAAALLARTKDLRVVAQLTRAWVQARGFAGLAQGLKLAAALLETYWDKVHPELEIEGQFDPLPRVNVLRELAGESGCTQAVRECAVIAGMNARALAAVLARLRTSAQDPAATDARVVADLRAAYASAEPALIAALDVLDALRTVRETVSQRLGHEWAFEASAIERDLSAVAESLTVVSREHDEKLDARAPSETQTPSLPASPALLPTEIRTRGDVTRCLADLCRYFERYEPSHPAPLLLRRVERLLALDFYEIMRDLAPDGLHQLDVLTGRSADRDRGTT